MSIPIVFFHYGNSNYLKYSLKQAKDFNPNSRVYLLGDEKNNRYNFVTHIQATQYKSEADKFAGIYRHQSSNNRDYELNCFLRWFYIKAFCRENNIGPFIYLDSDVLLFQDVSEMMPYFKDAAIANIGETAGVPAFTYFKDYNAIADFCSYLLRAYTQNSAIKELEEFYEPFANDPEMMGGVCDMTLFHFYFRDYPHDTLKIDLINDELAVDVSINNSDGYEMENGIKKVYWQHNLPYCKRTGDGKLIRFTTLHYQGDAKKLMPQNFKGSGYAVSRAWELWKQRGK